MSRSRNECYIKKFGLNLRRIRQEKKLTMSDVAYSTRMELNSIYRIETGKVDTSICNLNVIAKALNIHPSDLLNF